MVFSYNYLDGYDVGGKLIYSFDVVGVECICGYDVFDCLVSVVDNVNGMEVLIENIIVIYEYDVSDNLMRVVDLSGFVIIYVYDGKGNCIGL